MPGGGFGEEVEVFADVEEAGFHVEESFLKWGVCIYASRARWSMEVTRSRCVKG